jgi:hypothetical protein
MKHDLLLKKKLCALKTCLKRFNTTSINHYSILQALVLDGMLNTFIEIE